MKKLSYIFLVPLVFWSCLCLAQEAAVDDNDDSENYDEIIDEQEIAIRQQLDFLTGKLNKSKEKAEKFKLEKEIKEQEYKEILRTKRELLRQQEEERIEEERLQQKQEAAEREVKRRFRAETLKKEK